MADLVNYRHPLTLVLVTLASIVYMLQIVGFSRTLKHLTNMHAFFEELLEIPDVSTFLQNVLKKQSRLLVE